MSGEERTRRIGRWPWLVLLVCLVTGIQRDHGPGGELIPWLAAAVVLTALAPTFLRSRTRRLGGDPGGPIPFIALIGVGYAAYFGLPALLSDQVSGIGFEVSNESLIRGLEIAWVGVAALGFGYLVVGPRLSFGRRIDLDWDPGRARALAFGMLPIGLAAELIPRWFELPAMLHRPVNLLSVFLPVSIGALVLLARRRELHRAVGTFAWFGLVPLFLLLEAGDGYVGSAAKSGVFVAMLVWGTGRRIPLWILVGGVVLVAVLRAGGHEYRRMTAGGHDAGSIGAVEQVETVFTISAQQVQERGLDEVMSVFVDRVAQIVVLSWVAERTPGVVPLWGGRTFAAFPSSFVPRALWPDKPSKEVGQDFGHRYGILAADDRSTSINLPQLVEWYINFGMLGVMFGMALIGALYRRLDTLLNYSGASDANVLLAAALLSPLMNIESDTSLVFGELVQLAIVIGLTLRLARRPERRAGGEAHPAVVRALGGTA